MWFYDDGCPALPPIFGLFDFFIYAYINGFNCHNLMAFFVERDNWRHEKMTEISSIEFSINFCPSQTPC